MSRLIKRIKKVLNWSALRQTRFATLLVIMLCLIVPTLPALANSGGATKNIVLIMADDLGYEGIGSNGCVDYTTPRIDALAKAGMRFEHCYANPVCTPSRVKLMTGKYNFRNYAGFGFLKRGERTFAHHLREAGYQTFIGGKWQLNGGYGKRAVEDGVNAPEMFGFDEFCLWWLTGKGPRYWAPDLNHNKTPVATHPLSYGPTIVANTILDFIQQQVSAKRPFFVYHSMILPHSPFVSTPDTPFPMQAMKTRTGKEHFASMVAYMDKLVGRIHDSIVQHGIAENTVIIFTGDNGTHPKITTTTTTRDVKGGKWKTTDAGTHVPLVVWAPGTVAAGTTSNALIDFTDFFPTLLDIAQLEHPGGSAAIDGKSFYPVLRGEISSAREFCYALPSAPVERWVRNERYKLYGDGKMFDTQADPLEKTPLESTALPTLRDRMTSAMDGILAMTR